MPKAKDIEDKDVEGKTDSWLILRSDNFTAFFPDFVSNCIHIINLKLLVCPIRLET